MAKWAIRNIVRTRGVVQLDSHRVKLPDILSHGQIERDDLEQDALFEASIGAA